MDHSTLLEFLGLARVELEEIALMMLMSTQIAKGVWRLSFPAVSNPLDLNESKCSCELGGLGPVRRKPIEKVLFPHVWEYRGVSPKSGCCHRVDAPGKWKTCTTEKNFVFECKLMVGKNAGNTWIKQAPPGKSRAKTQRSENQNGRKTT